MPDMANQRFLTTLVCGHQVPARFDEGEEVDCPECTEERSCAVCSSYGTTQTEVEWRGHTRKVWLCRFCWAGVG